MELNNRVINKALLIIVFLGLSIDASSEWTGPEILIEETWGGGKHQIGKDVSSDYYYQEAAGSYDIATDGSIVISDRHNNRAKIYSKHGELIRLLELDEELVQRWWDSDPVFIGKNILIKLDRYYIYGDQSEIIGEFEASRHTGFFDDFGNSFIIQELSPVVRWKRLEFMGVLIENVPTKPLELGHFLSTSRIYNDLKVNSSRIDFGDSTFNILNDSLSCADFKKVNNKNIMCIEGAGARKASVYNQCGNLVEEFFLPLDDVQSMPINDSHFEDIIEVNYFYSNLSIDWNGDIYAIKETKDTYSLLKWVWKEMDELGPGPVAPYALAHKEEADFIDIKWTVSLQDPGCVTEYKIFRTETEENIEKQIGTVSAGVEIYRDTSVEAGKEYTYRLKATSSLGDSEFSDSVTVTIPEE